MVNSSMNSGGMCGHFMALLKLCREPIPLVVLGPPMTLGYLAPGGSPAGSLITTSVRLHWC